MKMFKKLIRAMCDYCVGRARRRRRRRDWGYEDYRDHSEKSGYYRLSDDSLSPDRRKSKTIIDVVPADEKKDDSKKS